MNVLMVIAEENTDLSFHGNVKTPALNAGYRKHANVKLCWAIFTQRFIISKALVILQFAQAICLLLHVLLQCLLGLLAL